MGFLFMLVLLRLFKIELELNVSALLSNVICQKVIACPSYMCGTFSSMVFLKPEIMGGLDEECLKGARKGVGLHHPKHVKWHGAFQTG